MIRGMTGFGSAQAAIGQAKISVEIKSLNHRYFDISHFLPPSFGSVENKITQVVKKHLERGRISVSIKVSQKQTQAIAFNKNIVKQYLEQSRSLTKEFKLSNDLTLSHLLQLPGVLQSKEVGIDGENAWPVLEKELEKAVGELVKMRKAEGKSLAKDIRDKLQRMLKQLSIIKLRAAAILRDKKKILTDDEFKSFQKSSDINEETARLGHYIEEMRALLSLAASVGKKMDFIAQEMQREVNTIGSKLQDKVVSNAVITLKSKVEKIREQSQNVE